MRKRIVLSALVLACSGLTACGPDTEATADQSSLNHSAASKEANANNMKNLDSDYFVFCDHGNEVASPGLAIIGHSKDCKSDLPNNKAMDDQGITSECVGTNRWYRQIQQYGYTSFATGQFVINDPTCHGTVKQESSAPTATPTSSTSAPITIHNP